ncbi:MAG: class I SAM-dependent methyltransferase [Microscillaceae bacterium]|jgi:cyclopropane fatty-acyl-phospholipid synthase-like methyltransferase|nr:class I SAM-dependent methyltransferase [Microscillaceae bacterium]
MNHWIDFWQGETDGFAPMMQKCTDFFAQKFHQKIPFQAQDKVLDIGCGAGFLGDFLQQNVPEAGLWGLDISERYIEICQKKFAHQPNFHFLGLNPQDYLNFAMLKQQKFDKIIVMSVVQYFQEEVELERLIQELSQYAAPGAVLIVADILVRADKSEELWHLARRAWQNSFFITFIKFVVYARFSAYYRHHRGGLLVISEQKLQQIAQKLGFSAEICPHLTINAARRSLIIRFG